MHVQIARALVIGAGLALATSVATPAFAQSKTKSVQTEAEWVNFNPCANTVTAKVKKPGRGKVPKELKLKSGKEAEWNVIPEGSILNRTSVSLNGKKGELTDIPVGKTVNIYWIPDKKDPTKRFARKIDLILSDEELDARYGTE